METQVLRDKMQIKILKQGLRIMENANFKQDRRSVEMNLA